MYDVPVAVKDTLRDGRLKKNYRLVVLNDDGTEDFTIDNDNLVSESVSIDERMCSGDTLKFGLCEGSSLEFQYFGLENIIGRRLQAFIDVKLESQWSQVANYSDITFATYIITEATAYEVIIPANQTTGVYVVWRHNGGSYSQSVGALSETTTVSIGDLSVNDEITLSRSITGRTFSAIINKSFEWYSIPLGFFDVRSCSRQASTGIIKVTAYNKLMSDYLDAKANNTILKTFGFSGTFTIHDIRELLLESYQIEEDIGELVTPVFDNDGELVSEETFYSDLGTFRFTKLYGVKSPINAYRAGVNSTSTDFHIEVTAQKLEVLYDSDYIRLNAYKGTLEGLEQNIVDYIKKVVDDAELNRSGDDVINYICQNIGFQKIFSVDLGRPGAHAYFSTTQWNYEEEHHLTHTVRGPITDKRVQLLTAGAILILPNTIDTGIRFWFDGSCQNVGNPPSYSTNYQYYSNSSWTVATAPCPYATFSDGTKYFMDYTDPETDKYYYAIAGWDYSGLPETDKIRLNPVNVEEFTLRDITSAVYESVAQFGQLNRVTDLFTGVELNHSRLLPADTLYPSDTLYPGGAAASATKSMYSKLWADEGNVHKWRYLIITYKTLNENNEEVERTLQRTVNNDGTDNYNMSDNWLMRNVVWTAEEVGEIADYMVAKMQDITWFPFEMWCAGLPYLETGDEIEIPLGEHSYTSYILQRQLKGIQNLQDTYINGTLDIF